MVAGRAPAQDSSHDPGAAIAAARAGSRSVAAPLHVADANIRIGTAGWTDRTLTAAGVFYPKEVKTPEDRLRYYASRFSMVEADMGFYAIPDAITTARWVERTPADFVFSV